MKHLYFFLASLSILACKINAQEAIPTQVMDKEDATSQITNTQTATPQNIKSNSTTNNESQTNTNFPLNLSRVNMGQEQDILSALNTHFELKDIMGKKMEVAEAKLFRSRFEKYLNAPAADTKEDIEYNQLLIDINLRLVGKGGGSEMARTIDAWKMLFKAAQYPIDNQLCRTIADKVINFWQTTKK